MKVVFCWTNVSGYMASCWRALSADKDIDLFVLAQNQATHSAFSDALLDDIPHRYLSSSEAENATVLKDCVLEEKPDVVVLSGWSSQARRKLVYARELSGCKFIMAMDTPFLHKPKQYLAPFLLRRYLSRISAVVVPGERAWRYAKILGFAEKQIFRGLYSVDVQSFHVSFERRRQLPWPKRFLFVGRYSEVKGLDILAKAYPRYRASVQEPWGLTCCGCGPLDAQLGGTGISNLGFVPPEAQPKLFEEHGVFVLPSRFDPWPLVIVEACAAGLPVLCTNACGSAVENVRHLDNGIVIATESEDALVEGLLWYHNNYEGLPTMGERSTYFASAYSPEKWTLRWKEAFKKCLGSSIK